MNSEFQMILDDDQSKSSDKLQDSAKDSIYPSIHNEPFYFESDSLALKGNSDYSCVLKTLALLEAQRMKSIKDLENLIDTKEKALLEPIKFVNYLQKRQINSNYTDPEFSLPTRQAVYVLPDIDWSKYYEHIDFTDEEIAKNENLIENFHSLRRARRTIPTREIVEQNTRQTRQIKQTEDKVNYNKSWDEEEQRMLEQLLVEFPPEDNEAARWRKIATKLGTRTPLQVQSHCQKYFIKLAKAGLPVPGRMPNLKTYVTKKGSRGCRKGPVANSSRATGIINSCNSSRRMIGRGSTLNEISSMWRSFNPPIKMNEHEAGDDYAEDDEDQQYEDEMHDTDTKQYDDAEDQFDHFTSSYENSTLKISPKMEPIYNVSDSETYYHKNDKINKG